MALVCYFFFFLAIFLLHYRVRGTVTPAKGAKKGRMEEEEEDLTRDMENPTPEPNVTEVANQGSKVTPAKGGNYLDLDEETTEKVEKTEPQVG